MADWNQPTNLSDYQSGILPVLKGRDEDSATLFLNPGNNIPTGSIRYLRSGDKLQEWNGTAWVDKVLSISGGGTGAANVAAARTALGLGTMAVQNNNAVNITGGSITGTSIDVANLTGTLPLVRGGTGASLALGAAGSHLQSNGSTVVFSNDGSQLAALNASNLATGTVPQARLPGSLGAYFGTVFQHITVQTNLTASYAFLSGFSLNITPKSATNRIRVICTITLFGWVYGGPSLDIDLGIFRNGSLLREFLAVQSLSGTPSGEQLTTTPTVITIDSPSTTASVNYALAGKAAAGTCIANFSNYGQPTSYMELAELS